MSEIHGGEVTRENFEDKFKGIEKRIKNAAFIAIDSEFSGLLSSSDLKSSLFDAGNQRYRKLRENVEDFIIIQFGITLFEFNRDSNKYSGTTYCFYLFPRTFSSVDIRFKCQASSFEFLCHHKFDFNKFAYEGISFLDESQDQMIQEDLKEGRLFRLVERTLSHEDEEAVQTLCSQVALWLAGGKPTEGATDTTLILPTPKSSQSSQCISYILHHELRRRFVSIWTFPDDDNVRVHKVSGSERAMLEVNESHEIEMQAAVVLSLRGFSRVFKLLVEVKKPIVGHNCLLDFMIMHKQFYQPLPKSYDDFKSSIHSLFPHIFDTKFISSELRRKIPRINCWNSNALEPLYNYFRTGKGANLVPFSPVVLSPNFSEESARKFHDAGWDSYCAGFCFIRLAHFFGSLANGKLIHARPLTSTEHLSALSSMSNRVNMIRGNINHFVLDGKDPPSNRPDAVIVKTRNGRKLPIIELTEQLSKYGSVDVKMISNTEALVAASTVGILKDITRDYYMNPDLAVVKYSRFRHDPIVRCSMWFGLAIVGGAFGFLGYRAISHR